MKILRIFGIVIGIALVLLAILAGVVYALFDSEAIKTQLTQSVYAKTQRQLVIDGPLALSFWPNLGVRLGRATLSEHASTQPFLAFNSARISVAVMPLLKKQVAVNGLAIDGLNLRLIKRRDGTLNIADLLGDRSTEDEKVGADETAGKEKRTKTPLHIDIDGIQLRNAQLVWHDEKTGATTTLSKLDFSTGAVAADSASGTLAIDALKLATHLRQGSDDIDLAFSAPRLRLTPEQANGESLTLDAKLAGAQRQATGKLVLANVSGTRKALKATLTLDVDGRFGATQLKTHLTSPLALTIDTQTIALEKLAGNADVVHPVLPMKQLKLPLAGNLRADLARQQVRAALATKFDDSRIDLAFSVGRFSPLQLGFDLAIDRLNVDRYLPPKSSATAAAPTASTAATNTAANTAAEKPLDFSAIRGLNLQGDLRIGALQVSHLKFANLRARLRAANDRLVVVPLTANLYGGTLNGSVGLDAQGNAVSLRQSLNGIAIEPLLKDLANKDLLAGKGTVTLDVTGHGATLTALKQSLAGSAALNLRDGAIKGINLAQSVRQAKALLGKQDATQVSQSGQQTDFSELTASFRIRDGVAHNDDLSMKSPYLRLGGVGDIDIGHNRIDYLAKATVVNTDTGQGGQGLDELRGLTIPVRLSGPLEKISWKIELGEVLRDAAAAKAKAKLDEKKQELRQKVDDQLKEKIKGLFGK